MMLYELKKYDLRISFSNHGLAELRIEFALGPEVRTFEIKDFVQLSIAMMDIGCRAIRVQLWPSGNAHKKRARKIS